jgi:PAS domain S-box-containing protein
LEQKRERIVEGTGVKILIVDDNIKSLYMLEVLLKGSGYEVVTAKNGIEALEKLRASQFDGIVSDILMPLMDGFRLIRECKKDPVLRQLLFIFYTATYTEKKDEEFGLSLGAIRYIIKPAEPEELLQQIHEAFIDHARSPTDHTMQPVSDEVAFSREYTNRVGAKLDKRARALKESEERYRTLAEESTDQIFIIGRDDTMKYVNIAALELFHLPYDQVIGKPRKNLFTPDIADAQGILLKKIFETGEKLRTEEKIQFGTQELWIDTNLVPLKDVTGNVTEVLGVSRDITERKKAEERLKRFNEELEKQVIERTEALNKTLHEKEILLQEIHHRVKNNMQIITSLLNLQSRTIDDPVVLNMIKESQSRIRAMALVHERIYKSGDISSIDLKDYIQFVTRELFSFYGVKSQLIRFTINAPAIKVNINSAIPLGLMVNELLTNAIKHAFPENRKGEIVIDITKDKKDISLVVRDNGIGIPQEFDWRNAKSLGLRLVISLVEQLSGTIELDRTAGTTFTIVVKEKE